jgi:long-subunit fatty acid transport protein
MKVQARAAFEKPKDITDSGLNKPVLKKRIRETIAALTVLCLVLAASSAWGERIEVGSSFNPVGSGARALGMGGAFIGVADDATAASWNPGGLTQLDEPEMSVVWGYTHRIEHTDIEDHPESVGSESFSPSNLNYLSFAYPFEFRKSTVTYPVEHGETSKGPLKCKVVENLPMTISLNYQKMYDFYHGWSYSLDEHDSFFTAPTQGEYEQDGALYALGLAFSIDLTNNFALGFTLNYWGDFIFENKWEQNYYKKWENLNGTDTEIRNEKYEFRGWNAHTGFLWRISEKLRLGGVFKCPFTADIERSTSGLQTHIDTNKKETLTPLSGNYDEKLRMPMSYGIGLAYRLLDNFILAADVYRTHWEDFKLKYENEVEVSPLSGKEMNAPNFEPIKNTTWFRIGSEWVHIIRDLNLYLSVRGGIFYDPAPSEGKTDEYYGASAGIGAVWNRCVLDFAYQFRRGNDVNTAMSNGLSQDIDEHTVYSSLIIYF